MSKDTLIITQRTHPIQLRWVAKTLAVSFLVLLAVEIIVLIGAFFFMEVPLSFSELLSTIAGLTIFFILVLVVGAILLLYWRGRFHYEINEDGITIHEGFLVKAVKKLDWNQIGNPIIIHNLFDQIFDLTKVIIPLKDPVKLYDNKILLVNRRPDGIDSSLWGQLGISQSNKTSHRFDLNLSGLTEKDAKEITDYIESKLSK